MSSECSFSADSTIYVLRSVIRMMIPYGQNAIDGKWRVNRFKSVPFEGCSVQQITEATEVLISDFLTSIAMCKEITELDAVWHYQAINTSISLTIKDKVGRLHFTDPKMQNNVGQFISRFNEQPDQFP